MATKLSPGPPHREDGPVSDVAEKTKPEPPTHKTYSILENPLISNPIPTEPRQMSAKSRKVLAWSKKIGLIREARVSARRAQTHDDRPPAGVEDKDPRHNNRSRRWIPDDKLNESRPGTSTQHRARTSTSFTDKADGHEKENLAQPAPQNFDNYRDHPHHRHYYEERPRAQRDHQSPYYTDHQSAYPEPRRYFQLDRESPYPSDQLNDQHETRRFSNTPEAPRPPMFPPPRQHRHHPPNLVPNYPPSHYHLHPQTSVQLPNIQTQPVQEFETSFQTQQPLSISQPSPFPGQYNSHQSHPTQIPPIETYHQAQVHHSPPVPQPVVSNYEINHTPYYTHESLEQRRKAFELASERASQEPHPHAPRPVMPARFVPNYPVAPAHHESETCQSDSFQPASSLVQHPETMEFKPSAHQIGPSQPNPESDRHWKTEEGSRWPHETLQVDAHHETERTQEFARTEEPILIPPEPPQQPHFYPTHTHQSQIQNGSSTGGVKTPHEYYSQWHRDHDDDTVAMKKEAHEIMSQLSMWGVTGDYLLGIGVSEALVRAVFWQRSKRRASVHVIEEEISA